MRIVRGFLAKRGGFSWIPGLLGFPSWSQTKTHPLCSKRVSKATASRKQGQSLLSWKLYFFLPPLGRESLKSPSMASQVLPSPPQTRQRSSFASEFRMLSQPTCFEINNTKSEVRRLKLEAVCSFVSTFFPKRTVLTLAASGPWDNALAMGKKTKSLFNSFCFKSNCKIKRFVVYLPYHGAQRPQKVFWKEEGFM